MRSLGVWEFGSLDNSFKEFRSLGVWTIPFHLEYSSRQANYPFSIFYCPSSGSPGEARWGLLVCCKVTANSSIHQIRGSLRPKFKIEVQKL